MDESKEEFLVRLKDLKGSGYPWHEIGAALRARPEIAYPRSWRQLIDDVHRATGVSPVMLSRYVAVLKELELIAPDPTELSSLVPGSFTGAEVAVRLYHRNREKGLQALKDLREGLTTIDKIRDDLAKEPSRRQGFSHPDRAKSAAGVETLLAMEAGRLFGAGSRVVGRTSVPYLCRHGFEVMSPDGNSFAGVDLYFPDTQDPLEPLARSILLSRYFPRFYVMLAPGFSEDDLGRAAAVLEAFAADSVGLLHMPDENSIRQHRKAPYRSEYDPSDSFETLAANIRDTAARSKSSAAEPEDETPSSHPRM